MKTAQAIWQELVSHVRPPQGVKIALTERPSNGPADPNWIAGCGNMDQQKSEFYAKKIAELRKTDPIIDWSAVGGQPRCIGKN